MAFRLVQLLVERIRGDRNTCGETWLNEGLTKWLLCSRWGRIAYLATYFPYCDVLI